MRNAILYRCKVCGYKDTILPWGKNGDLPSFEICDCCGVEYGYEDATPSAVMNYRKQWIQNGAKWACPEKRPSVWDLEAQLATLYEEHMRGFIFTDETICEFEDVFYVRMSPYISSKQELLEALHYSCWFPVYFGFSWDALAEALSDFSWIKEKTVIIRHESTTMIPKEDFIIYIELIARSLGLFLKDDKNMCYVFSEKDKDPIDNILTSIGLDRLGREIK